MKEQNKLIDSLQSDLDRYDKVILVLERKNKSVSDRKESEKDSLDNKRMQDLVTLLYGGKILENKNRKALLLVSEKYFGEIEGINEGTVTCRQVTEEEASFMHQLYRMYEFSDRFSVISNENAYGNLFHFLDTGLFSMEEIAEALLH